MIFARLVVVVHVARPAWLQVGLTLRHGVLTNTFASSLVLHKVFGPIDILNESSSSALELHYVLVIIWRPDRRSKSTWWRILCLIDVALAHAETVICKPALDFHLNIVLLDKLRSKVVASRVCLDLSDVTVDIQIRLVALHRQEVFAQEHVLDGKWGFFSVESTSFISLLTRANALLLACYQQRRVKVAGSVARVAIVAHLSIVGLRYLFMACFLEVFKTSWFVDDQSVFFFVLLADIAEDHGG